MIKSKWREHEQGCILQYYTVLFVSCSQTVTSLPHRNISRERLINVTLFLKQMQLINNKANRIYSLDSRYIYEPNAVCWPIIPPKCHFS